MQGQKTIGIIGGGQLGRMLTLAALPLGFNVIVVDPNEDSPAKQVGAEQIVGNLYDKQVLKQLADRSDYVTIEIEHLDADVLDEIAKTGTLVNPAPTTVRLIQDKFAQKQFLHKAEIPVAAFVELHDEAAAEAAFKAFGGKMLIKTRFGAYDGRGNMVIESQSDISEAFKKFAGQKLYAEQFIPFSKELAVMVARSLSHEVLTYPVVETIHERNICVEVQAPAGITAAQRDEAEQIALRVAHQLNGAGVYGIEMFLTENGEIIVNEIAPRVHNSGHYTMEASRTSQFEQHMRAISGLPLGSTDFVTPAAVMVNVLGERNGDVEINGLEDVLATPHVSLHLYGKSPTKVDRKMGHITATGDTIEQAGKRARKARKQLSI